MKKFKDLEIYGPKPILQTLPDLLTEGLCNGWTRRRDKETRVDANGDDTMFVFECSDVPGRRAAGLFLAYRGSDTLYLCNIVPTDAGRLSFEEYNRILDEFAVFVSNAISKSGLNVRVEASDGLWRLDEYVSSDAAEKLRRFSDMANRATGTAHPLDEERWFDFIVACHRDNCRLTATDLNRWLIDAHKWPDAAASDLAIEYESARSLLRHYDRG